MTTRSPQAVRPASQIGGPDQVLTDDAVRQFVTNRWPPKTSTVAAFVLVPDGTRSCPLPAAGVACTRRCTAGGQVTVLIALGTHAR